MQMATGGYNFGVNMDQARAEEGRRQSPGMAMSQPFAMEQPHGGFLHQQLLQPQQAPAPTPAEAQCQGQVGEYAPVANIMIHVRLLYNFLSIMYYYLSQV